MAAIYNKDNYTNKEFDYIPSATIKEYDMKSAGMNILISKKLLTPEQIDYLNSLPKEKRNYEIGIMQKNNKDLVKVINMGFKEYRKRFFEANEIDSSNVISIKRDAIFVVNTRIKHTKFDSILFRSKNKYSSYYRINNIELFYSKRENRLDIKGIDDDELKYHKNIISFLKKIIKLNEISNVSARRYLYNFADRYRKLELNRGYYREFKVNGQFRLKSEMASAYFTIEVVDEYSDIEINYNYMNVILPLIKMIF